MSDNEAIGFVLLIILALILTVTASTFYYDRDNERKKVQILISVIKETQTSETIEAMVIRLEEANEINSSSATRKVLEQIKEISNEKI